MTSKHNTRTRGRGGARGAWVGASAEEGRDWQRDGEGEGGTSGTGTKRRRPRRLFHRRRTARAAPGGLHLLLPCRPSIRQRHPRRAAPRSGRGSLAPGLPPQDPPAEHPCRGLRPPPPPPPLWAKRPAMAPATGALPRIPRGADACSSSAASASAVSGTGERRRPPHVRRSVRWWLARTSEEGGGDGGAGDLSKKKEKRGGGREGSVIRTGDARPRNAGRLQRIAPGFNATRMIL